MDWLIAALFPADRIAVFLIFHAHAVYQHAVEGFVVFNQGLVGEIQDFADCLFFRVFGEGWIEFVNGDFEATVRGDAGKIASFRFLFF